ncbi:MAG: hypothetical protein NC907_00865 [Candidatus Omnitrophica bacterium]|nr:hypothetical protein [Candidatus Omnitrophota bacterium]
MIIFFGMIICGITAIAQTLPAIVGNPDIFNEKSVIVKGELIGDIFDGRDGFWVNLLDSEIAIGIWFPKKEKEKIKFLGRYGIEGDFVKITGVFYKQCIQHKGDMDIHANSLEILKMGSKKDEKLPQSKIIFAFFLGIISLAAIGVLHLFSRRESLPNDREFLS